MKHALVKNTIKLLLLVVVSVNGLLMHGSALYQQKTDEEKHSHSEHSTHSEHYTTATCINRCTTAAINRDKQEILEHEIDDDETAVNTSFNIVTRPIYDGRSRAFLRYGTTIKPPPKIPIYKTSENFQL